MTKELQAALDIITGACASIVANLETHNAVQNAIALVKAELTKKPEK